MLIHGFSKWILLDTRTRKQVAATVSQVKWSFTNSSSDASYGNDFNGYNRLLSYLKNAHTNKARTNDSE